MKKILFAIAFLFFIAEISAQKQQPKPILVDDVYYAFVGVVPSTTDSVYYNNDGDNVTVYHLKDGSIKYRIQPFGRLGREILVEDPRKTEE